MRLRPRRLETRHGGPALLFLCAPALAACLERNPGFVGEDGPRPHDAAAPGEAHEPDFPIPPGCSPPCDSPPGPCWASPGVCDPQSGQCAYEQLPAGATCSLAGGCAPTGTCDAEGHCVAGPCSVPHATEGSCVDGDCVGFTCAEGRGDCNGDWHDGCEAQLATDPANCGACGQPCPSDAPNALASCKRGECDLVCKPPYANCNEDPADGCEIPVGEPNSCSRQGLTTFETTAGATPGCGTAYCGKGSWDDASFGSWFCTFCEHCQLFDDGGSWCLQNLGTFSSGRCKSCCDPNLFPQVCKP